MSADVGLSLRGGCFCCLVVNAKEDLLKVLICEHSATMGVDDARVSHILSAASAILSILGKSWPASMLRKSVGRLRRKRALFSVTGSSFRAFILRSRAVGLLSPRPPRLSSSASF